MKTLYNKVDYHHRYKCFCSHLLCVFKLKCSECPGVETVCWQRTDDLPKIAGEGWMGIAGKRDIWLELGKVYVQQ